MLSLFPIMFLALFAHAILRIVMGGILLFLGVAHYRHARTFSKKIAFPVAGAEVVCGLLLVAGFLTQGAALGALALALTMIVFHRRMDSFAESYWFYVLLIGVSLSLVITGAGAFAVDIPF